MPTQQNESKPLDPEFPEFVIGAKNQNEGEGEVYASECGAWMVFRGGKPTYFVGNNHSMEIEVSREIYLDALQTIHTANMRGFYRVFFETFCMVDGGDGVLDGLKRIEKLLDRRHA